MAGFVRIRHVESRPNLSFGRTLRLSSDRHDLIPPTVVAYYKFGSGRVIKNDRLLISMRVK